MVFRRVAGDLIIFPDQRRVNWGDEERWNWRTQTAALEIVVLELQAPKIRRRAWSRQVCPAKNRRRTRPSLETRRGGVYL